MNFYIMNAVNKVTKETRAFGVTAPLLREARLLVDAFTPDYFEPAYFIFSVPALTRILGVIELTPTVETDETPVVVFTPAVDVSNA